MRMKYTYQQAATITVEDIYGRCTPEVPHVRGHKVLDFRPPKIGEYYLGVNWNVKQASLNFCDTNPRYIVLRFTPRTIVLTLKEVMDEDTVVCSVLYEGSASMYKFADGSSSRFRVTQMQEEK